MALRSAARLAEDISKGAVTETSPSSAYLAALAILRQEDAAFGETIWLDLGPNKTRSLRAARRRLRMDIAVLEALLARARRNNI